MMRKNTKIDKPDFMYICLLYVEIQAPVFFIGGNFRLN